MGRLFWRSGGGAPSRRRRSPQLPEANGGLVAELPALENFAFFCKNNLILRLF